MKPTVITIALLLSGAIMSARADSQVWTFADCVGYAREHNIDLQKSRLSEETSAYNLEEAEAQWQPTLDFATTHSYANYPWAEGAVTATTARMDSTPAGQCGTEASARTPSSAAACRPR